MLVRNVRLLDYCDVYLLPVSVSVYVVSMVRWFGLIKNVTY